MTLTMKQRIELLEEENRLLISNLADYCDLIEETNRSEDPITILQQSIKDLHNSDAANVIKLTMETQEIATKMSWAIRKRDSERIRATMLRSRLDEIDAINNVLFSLESSLSSGVLNDLCSKYEFLAEKCNIKEIRDCWREFYGGDVTLEDRMNIVKKVLLSRLKENIQDVLDFLDGNENKNGRIDEVMTAAFNEVHLFQKINCALDSVKVVSEIIHRYAEANLRVISDAQNSNLDLRFALKANKVGEFVRGLVDWVGERIRSMNLSEAYYQVTFKIFLSAETALSHIIDSFKEEKKVDQRIDAINKNNNNSDTPAEWNIKELDIFAAEVGIILQRCAEIALLKEKMTSIQVSSDLSPIAEPDLQVLFSQMTLLVDYYSAAECAYLANGFKMAISVNEVLGLNSTVVEDIIFLVRKCILRSISVKEFSCIKKVIDAATKTCNDKIHPFLQKRAKQLYPDPKTQDSVTITANDAKMLSNLLESVLSEIGDNLDIERGFPHVFPLEGVRSHESRIEGSLGNLLQTKLKTCLNEIELQCQALDAFSILCLETMYTTQVQSKLSAILSSISSEVFSDDEEEAGSSMSRIIIFMEKTLKETILNSLIEDNSISMVLLIAAECARYLEKMMLGGKVTLQTAEMLEHELREVASYFADATGLESKSIFAKLLKYLSILTCPTLIEAEELITETTKEDLLMVQISDKEKNLLLQVRTDW